MLHCVNRRGGAHRTLLVHPHFVLPILCPLPPLLCPVVCSALPLVGSQLPRSLRPALHSLHVALCTLPTQVYCCSTLCRREDHRSKQGQPRLKFVQVVVWCASTPDRWPASAPLPLISASALSLPLLSLLLCLCHLHLSSQRPIVSTECLSIQRPLPITANH